MATLSVSSFTQDWTHGATALTIGQFTSAATAAECRSCRAPVLVRDQLFNQAALLILGAQQAGPFSVACWLDKRKRWPHGSSCHMRPTYRIVPASEEDLHFLPVIELAAAQLLIGHAPEGVLSETTSIRHFRQAMDGGRLWVAVTGRVPVGFVHVDLLPSGGPHLEEIDVHPSHGRQGLGRRLVATACDWVTRQGHSAITLTTFRDIPFNRAFYASCGFHEIPAADLDSELAAIVKNEAQRGLAPERRVVMRWPSPA